MVAVAAGLMWQTDELWGACVSLLVPIVSSQLVEALLEVLEGRLREGR